MIDFFIIFIRVYGLWFLFFRYLPYYLALLISSIIDLAIKVWSTIRCCSSNKLSLRNTFSIKASFGVSNSKFKHDDTVGVSFTLACSWNWFCFFVVHAFIMNKLVIFGIFDINAAKSCPNQKIFWRIIIKEIRKFSKSIKCLTNVKFHLKVFLLGL